MDRETTNPTSHAGRNGLRPHAEHEADTPFGALLDGDGLVLAVASASVLEAGIEVESVIGTPLRDTVWWAWSEPAQARLEGAIDRARRGLSSTYHDELGSGSGPSAPVELQIVPIASGGALRIVVTSIDATRNARRAQRSQKELLEARVASAAKSAFLATMSHEIRTPITSILGYSDILLSRAVDGADVQALEAIERSAQHLVRMVNDILDLTRIESGRLELRDDVFSASELARDLRSIMSRAAEAKGIELTVSASGPIPTAVRTDAARVRQIVVNLVSNAVRYTMRGSVRVIVGWIPARSLLEFRVEDTGIGIAPAELERIFEPFVHADASATREHEGCGLGLAIARPLAQSLGGTLAVESRLGAGSAFTLRIVCPLAPGAVLEVPVLGGHSRPPHAPALEPARLDGLRVLAVDDLREIRHIVQYYLEEAGADVRTASDGAGAVEEVASAIEQGRPFDAMVLDMQMPNVDGWMAARKIREMGQSIPIIALTASGMVGDRERALEAGCTDHVVKPIRPRELVHTVRKHAEARELAQPRSSIDEHVLFVDDDADLREMMSLLLGSRGYRVSTAGTCSRALEIALADRPQVVLSDLSLPDGDGHRLVETLRARLGRTPTVVYIAVSGHDRAPASSSVFDRLLQKPVRLPTLVQAIEDVEASLAAESAG